MTVTTKSPAGTPNDLTTQGFTRIELLLVIAILAILTVMLLPALAKAKLKATRAACLCYPKKLGLALVVYAGEKNEKFIALTSPTAS